MITSLASGATDRELWLLLGAGLFVGAGVLLAALALWPLAAFAGSFASIGAWGLLAHRAAARPAFRLWALQGLLALLGCILAVVAMLALFFGMLGPRWML
jgi:hypothetical protein